MASRLYVINFKMNLSVREEREYLARYADDLEQLAQKNAATIVLCPSFVSLTVAQALLHETTIAWGAQDCSSHFTGAFTGQVSAMSLQDLGCSFCIVGHSERRILCHESSGEVAQKALRLIDYGITPIICVGEGAGEDASTVVKAQLEPVFELLGPIARSRIIIAYEPLYAIGGEEVADPDHVETVISFIKAACNRTNDAIYWEFLYGGAITSRAAPALRKISALNGFLVGRAGSNFTEFKKIVEWGTVSDDVELYSR